MKNIIFRSIGQKVAKAVILFVAFLFVIVPGFPVKAQIAVDQSQIVTPAVSEQPVNKDSKNLPVESDPAELDLEKSQEGDAKVEPQPVDGIEEKVKEEEKPKEEEPQPEAMMSVVNTTGNTPKFDVGAQPKANVDLSSGALVYEYPIELPQGRAGMTPELSLKYDSRFSAKPDSYTGMGWEVSIPYIQREPIKGTQNLYTSAYFSSSISGNLIATTDTSTSQFTTYRPESDKGEYLKYTYNSDNTWSVTGKDGRTYTFGGSAASRQDKPGDSTKVFKWMLSKIADTHGNEIQYTYLKDSGQIYPSQIVYTYHAAAAAAHTVNFTYTTPTTQGATTYNPAFAVTTYKRLWTIAVSTIIDSQTATISYTLNYDPAQNNVQSLLKSVTRTASLPVVGFNQSFPDTTSFSYSTKTPGWQQGTHSIGAYYPNVNDYVPKGTFVADFDANGYPDVLVSTSVGGGSYTAYNYFLMNNGTTFTESSSAWNLPVHPTALMTGPYYAIVDLNGDHLPDLHPRKFTSGNPSAYINTGSSFSENTSGNWEIATYVPEAYNCGPNTGESSNSDANTFLYDINNDGKNDILHFGGSSDFRVFLNNGNGFTSSSAYTLTPQSGSNWSTNDTTCDSDYQQKNYQLLADFNGDGLADYYHQNYGTHLNTGSGFAYNAAYNLGIEDIRRVSMADINGDGLFDFVDRKALTGGSWCIVTMLNTGTGFTAASSPSFPTSCGSSSNPWHPNSFNYLSNDTRTYGTLVDFTADGFPDVIGAATTGTNGKLRSISDAKSSWVTNPNTNDPWTPFVSPGWGVYFDVNSDEAIDYISHLNDNAAGTCPALTANKKVCMGKPTVPNRLSQITTPLGAQTVIEYGTAPTNQRDTNPSPLGVVKKVTVQNIGQSQPSMVMQYSYTNGTYVIDPASGQKRFAGFHKVTGTESGSNLTPLRTTETYLHQANGSDGATNEPTDNNLSLIGKPYYTVVKHPSGTPKKEIWNKYGSHTLVTEPVTSRLSKFVYPAETVVKTTDSSTTVGTAEAYTFDTTLGERTELRNMGFVTVGSGGSYTDISGDTRYEFTEYANNTGSTIVKPKRVDIRTTPSSGDTVSRTDYFYDSQTHGTIGSLGDLTKETKWISGNGTTTADTTYTYDSFGNVATITNPRTALATYTYDTSKSLVATETNHLNHVTTNEYMAGYLKKVTDPNGRIVSYVYSDKGWLYKTTVANTAGNQDTIQYLESSPGGVWSIATIDYPVGSSPDYSWQALDGLGRPTRQIRRLTNHTALSHGAWYLKEAKTYDDLGRLSTVSAPYGTPNSNDWHYLISTSLPSNLITTTSYDVFDRPTSVVNSLGTTSTSYAGTEATTTDANSNQKKAKSDAYGNLIQVKEYDDSNVYTTNYSYDTRNLLTGITDALGNVRAFSYNNAGWLTNSEDLHASGDSTFGSTSWTYDLNGNQLVETQPNGVTVTRVYDMLDRPTSIDGSSTGANDYTLTYDSCTNGKGRVCTVSGTLPNSVTLSKSFVYGVSGVPTSVSLTTLGNTYTTSYQYNLSDEVKQVTYPNNTIVRTDFGDWAKPATIYTTMPGGSETTYATVSYHHTEQPSTIAITSGPTTTYTYDSAKLYRKTNMTAVQGGNTLQSYGYTYDNVNNITQITEPNLTKTYTYDDLNRLTQAIHTPSGGGATTYTYAYNAIGNITSANGNSYSYSGTGKTNPHAVTSVGSNNYTYDDNGNITTAPNQAFTYNWQNQAQSIVVGGSTTINSSYDESGNRFLYQTPTNTEIQAADNYLLRNGTPEIAISVGNIPIGTVSGTTTYAAIADHLGTPVKQVNSSGAAVESVSYDPFGKVLTQTGTVNTKNGFTQHEEDIDTGLVYANARYYSPAIGRFLSQDPAFWQIQRGIEDPQLMNSYSYARNNPLTYLDPNGEWPTLAQVNSFLNRAERYNPITYLYGGSADRIANGLYTGNYKQAAIGAVDATITTVLVVDTALTVGMGVGSLYAQRQSTNPAPTQKLLPAPQSQPALTSGQQPAGQTRFLYNAEVDDYGRITRGTVDLKSTFDRISDGQKYNQFANDGATFLNKEGRLPSAADPNYYTEHVIRTPGINNRPGPQRLITGKGGEAYYTGNHYKSFTKVKGQAGSR